MSDTRAMLDRTRASLLSQVESFLEVPMAVFGLLWLALLVVELLRGDSLALTRATTIVWVIFGAEFLLRLGLAPRKMVFLRRNWLTILSLVLPAIRVLRLTRTLRLFRVARGMRLLRLMTSMNRGLRALRRTLRRRGVGYVGTATVIVTFVGAAGMKALETGGPANAAFASYADALWWTAMLMTTMGSDAWPATPEGRLLSVALALYAFVVFGYLTASLASHFIGQDASARATGRHAG